MLQKLNNYGLNSDTLYFASIMSVFLSIVAWLVRQGDNRAAAERFGIFVGLWAPTVLMLGKIMEDVEQESIPLISQ